MGMTPEQAEVLKLKGEKLSNREIGQRLGINESAVRKRLARAKKWASASEGMKASLETSGINIEEAHSGWRIIQHEDGSRDSVYWMADRSDPSPEEVEDRIAAKMADIPSAPVVIRPKSPKGDIRALYPLFDVHLAMRIGDYGLDAAVERVTEGMASLIGRTDPAETAIILNGGDFTHQNDQSNQTPKSKNPLEVDGGYEDTIDAAVEVTVAMIDMALQRHQHVVYKPLRGNHDPATAIALRAALSQRYRGSERVSIDKGGVVFFAHEWGDNLICAHHGDARGASNPKDMVMRFAAKHAPEWGRTRHRELWTGHMHHLKSWELPGMTWYQARAVSPASRHDLEEGYDSRAEMLSVTYHKTAGRVAVANHVFT